MATELIQNVWTRYGFRGNPFDTAALSASTGTLLPVSKAMVGRDMDSAESKMLLGGTPHIEGEARAPLSAIGFDSICRGRN